MVRFRLVGYLCFALFTLICGAACHAEDFASLAVSPAVYGSLYLEDESTVEDSATEQESAEATTCQIFRRSVFQNAECQDGECLTLPTVATVTDCPTGQCPVPSATLSGTSSWTVEFSPPVAAAGLGSAEYAQRLNRGRFRHDPTWRGYEVIFWSSGTATEPQARAAWLRSPPHRRLLLGGKITEIACVGNACVGRGLAAGANAVGATVDRFQARQPVRGFLRRLFR